MSKFLTIVENNVPAADLDDLSNAKRDLQRLLQSKGIESKSKTFRDVVCITLNDKIIEVEIKAVRPVSEDAEDEVDAISAIARVPDPKPGKKLGPNDTVLANSKKTIARSSSQIAARLQKMANTPSL